MSATPDPRPIDPNAPLDVDAISARTFGSAFRGWDPDEVRVHLVRVAEGVRVLQQQHADLERRLVEAEAAARRANTAELDPEEVSKVLGEETARVLRSAREAAEEIRQKAEDRVAQLTREASDEAAASRARIEAEATEARRRADEEVEATRATGEAYVSDLKRSAEQELAVRREAVETELAEQRQAAREESALLRAEADEAAARVTEEADAAADRTRTEADAYATATRSDADDYAARTIADAAAAATARSAEAEAAAGQASSEATAAAAEMRAAAESELADARQRAASQIEEAQVVRERVLADLAKRRKAAREHLEQLHAARDRLLAAYEVVRGTVEEATREMTVVLPEAKRAADEAARRVATEPDLTIEQLEAELVMARDADLPLVAGLPSRGGSSRSATSAGSESGPADPDSTASAAVELRDEDVHQVTAGGERSGPESAAASGKPDDAPEPVDESTPAAGPDITGGSAAEAESGSPATSTPAIVATTPEVTRPEHVLDLRASADARARRSGRLFRRRDPLHGDSLPDAPLEPVDAAAPFEDVRVIGSAGPVEAAPRPPIDVPALVARKRAEPAAAASRAESATGSDETVAGRSESESESATGSDETVAGRSESESESATGSDETVAGRSESESESEGATDPDETVAGTSETTESESAEDESAADTADAAGTPDTAAAATSDDHAVAGAGAKDEPAKVDDIFARIRAGRAESADADADADAEVAEGAEADPASEPEPTSLDTADDSGETAKTKTKGAAQSGSTQRAGAAPKVDEPSPEAQELSLLEKRDGLVAEVEGRLAKRMKRVLSDEQSTLLDEVRRSRRRPTADQVLPGVEEQRLRYVEAAVDELRSAVIAGVRFAGDVDDRSVVTTPTVVDDIAEQLAEQLAGPLRARIERALADDPDREGDDGATAADELELADRIRSCYREWRNQRVAEAVADATLAAFTRGLYEAYPTACSLRWVVDNGGTPCPDADDNALAGVLTKGEAFPTGHVCPPAHAGCRCLVVPAPQ